jgi:hypothetical protein
MEERVAARAKMAQGAMEVLEAQVAEGTTNLMEEKVAARARVAQGAATAMREDWAEEEARAAEAAGTVRWRCRHRSAPRL